MSDRVRRRSRSKRRARLRWSRRLLVGATITGGAGLAATALLLVALAVQRASPPHGQVLAKVDGAEVTVQDVLAESRASAVPDWATTRAALLDRVISRRLLAASARRQKLDRTPEGPSDRGRVEQTWLAQLALSKVLTPVRTLDPSSLQKIKLENPYSFDRRTSYDLDSLTVAAGAQLADTLRGFSDLDLAAAALSRLGLPTTRALSAVDTATLPATVAAQLEQLHDGDVQLKVEPGRLTLIHVLSRAPITLPEEGQKALAQQLWSQMKTAERIRLEIARLRIKSRIVYAAGAAPSRDWPAS